MRPGDRDLGDFLDHEVVPLLSVEDVFTDPVHAWREKGKKNWKGSCPWHESRSGSSFTVDPVTLRWWCAGGCGGGGPIQYLWRKRGGTGTPQGADFVDMVRKLAGKAGVTFPERVLTEEERERVRRREARRSALEVATDHAHGVLLSEKGKAARAYLEGRGFTEVDMKDLRLGLYLSVADMRAALKKAGADEAEAKDTGLLWEKMVGYILIPWRDDRGHPLTLYGRWVGKPPEGTPKTMALPGEGTKRSPLYFDRARAAGLQEVVLVEGVFDAALLQARGDSRVVASVAARLSELQVETLTRNHVQRVFVCGDPDGGGDAGTLHNVEALTRAGIPSFVVPRLPDGLDPDEFLLREGLEGWKAHVSAAVHSETFLARQILAKHGDRESWKDVDLVEVLDEAVAHDEATTDPEKLSDLELFFWPLIREATGVGEDALHARLLAARERKAKAREAEVYQKLVQGVEEKVKAGDLEGVRSLVLDEAHRLRIEDRARKADPVRPVAEELADHEARLSRWRGKEFLGLPQRVITKLDEWTRGLRGLMLLAARPNVGKTALAVQLGTDVVESNPDAVFVFVSLEMPRWEILTRVRCRFAAMNWTTLVFGSEGAGRVSFTGEELARLQEADEKLARWGERILILDEKNFPTPSVEGVVAHVEALKARTGASRVFLLVDYLQVWPISPEVQRTVRTDLDADKVRIGAMKELRDALQEGDGVMVISEARKPSGDSSDEWGGALADVMGSARGSYTPDMVLLFNDVSDLEMGEWLGDPIKGSSGSTEANKKREFHEWKARMKEAREAMADQGYSLTRLVIAKGRDGVRRGEIRLTYRFLRSTFEEDWPGKLVGVAGPPHSGRRGRGGEPWGS